jgi:hypothetical protein
MQLGHAIAGLEGSVETQLRVAGADAAEIGAQLMAALQPAIRQTLMDVVALAAAEISGQLAAQKVEIRLVDGDPELVVVEDAAATPPPHPPAGGDDEEARITLRLPGYLKELINEAASDAGDSVNAFVVEILNQNATARRSGGTHHRATIEL